MSQEFEDHCWKDVVPAEVLDLYRAYERPIFVGPRPAVIVIDLYELVYQGGPHPISEVSKTYPSSCGIKAWQALEPTTRLLAAARKAGLPIFYSTGDTRPDSKPVLATHRKGLQLDPKLFEIRSEVAPHSDDVVITKQRASVFYGTPLAAQLTQLGIQSLIMLGESTSGCVRASAVDGYSYGYHVVLVEECCFDRSELSHKVNLFDLHHKYADVMKVDDVVAHLEKTPQKKETV